jgi:hypothetical protein
MSFRTIRISTSMAKQIMIFAILALLLLAKMLYSMEVVAVFKAGWDGPFFTVFLGKLAGYLPDQFSFRETTWKNRKGREEFFMALDDKKGRSWARLHSDTANESAVWLPRKHKETLNRDVVRFVRTLRNMFIDSSHHAMRGVFTFGKGKLVAEVAEFALSQDEAQKFRGARAFNVLTFDSAGTPGIRGRVVAAKDSALHYRKVSIYLPEDEIEVTLEE